MPITDTTRITGLKGAFLQPQTYGATAESGGYRVLKYRGTKAEIEAQLQQIGSPSSVEVRELFGGISEMEVRYASIDQTTPNSDVVNEWEFFGNKVESDILFADIAAINGMSKTNKQAIRDALAQNIDTPVYTVNGVKTNVTDPDTLTLFQSMVDGVKNVIQFQPFLRHTQTVSNAYTIKTSLLNVGRIYSTASLIAVEAVPSTIIISLPSGTSTKANATYGWLKHFPQVKISANSKNQIVQEWEYGLWLTSPAIYNAVL